MVELLRRLNDRFEQVIVITHIEQVREGLDRVLVVRFDEERGASVVTSGVASGLDDDEQGGAGDRERGAGGDLFAEFDSVVAS